MAARLASVLIVLVLIASVRSQDKPLRDVAPPPAGQVEAARHIVQPVPGVVLPNHTVQQGHIVFDHPVPTGAPHGIHGLLHKVAHCRKQCCHCVSEVAHFLYYRPLPIPNECLECKHFVPCTPDPQDFFVQRYGYYSWAARCVR